MDYIEKYNKWLESKYIDEGTKKELRGITNDKEIEDRFYKDLEFGTGGLRGIIGAGTNRMNVYTIGKATQGLSNYLKDKYHNEKSVTIAYDSRLYSKEFAEFSAKVLCGNGIKVNLFENLRPTPMLSYAVRKLGSKAGIVITASHNPKEYNGYKVYGEDGGQITDDTAKEIISYIALVKDFKTVKYIELEKAKDMGLLTMIGEKVDKSYIHKVKNLVIRKELVEKNAKELNIIYTPLHGTGAMPVVRALKELGFENLNLVKEQEKPDPTFRTVSSPNPENKDVFNIALEMAKTNKPDIIFGTDPDCDRIGVVVKDSSGEYRVLTGNQVGVLLTHYILSCLKEREKVSKKAAIIKTIVTTDMSKSIAESFNVKTIEVLTGFKYIGEKIKEFEEKKCNNFIFGFEESYGYLYGTFVRDKDAVIASVLICEMTLYYKSIGKSLYEALIDLYELYGYYKEELISIENTGKEGKDKIENALTHLRHSMKLSIGSRKIVKKIDYKLGIEKDLLKIKETKIDLPRSNVLKFIFDDESWIVIRPSGTEPKIKIYLSVKEKNKDECEEKMGSLKNDVQSILNEAF